MTVFGGSDHFPVIIEGYDPLKPIVQKTVYKAD